MVLHRRTGIFFLLLILVTGLTTGAYVLTATLNADEEAPPPAGGRILLLGASVGKAWNLSELPQRTGNDRYALESVAYYEYDKSPALEEILMRPKRKFRLTRTYLKGFFKPAPQLPDTIILKECAAYFPGDLPTYQALMKQWVERLRGANINVILATVVPVTRQDQASRPGRIESILAYNDWIREYAAQERLPLLDLEAAVRIDGTDRFLRDDLAIDDGLHLNKQAYDILDQLLQKTLKAAEATQAAQVWSVTAERRLT